MTDQLYTEKEWHLKQGAESFSEAFEFLHAEEPTDEEIFLMIHAAHAARYHYSKINSVQDIARSEWLVSKVYAHIGMGDQALLHGQYSFDLCQDNAVEDLIYANACEAIAQAALLLEDEDLFEGYYRMASDAAKTINDPKEKSHFLDGLKKLKKN